MSLTQPDAADRKEGVDAGERIARLHGMLARIERIGGCGPQTPQADHAIDEAAQLSAAYAEAPLVARRRFDALAEDSAAYAAAGIAALARISQSEGTADAARLLARELRRSIEAMIVMLTPVR